MNDLRIQPRAKMVDRAAKAYGLTFDDVVSHRRHRKLVHARWAAIYVIRNRWPDFSTKQLGKLFGGRDHSTICYAIGEAKNLYARDRQFRDICDLIAAEREPFGPVRQFMPPAPEVAPVCELVIAKERQAREVDDAAEIERNWTLSLAHIRRGSRELLKAIARAHPERIAA